MADDPIHQTWDPWKNPWITGIDETTVRDREFRREVLGEFVPPEIHLRESRIYRGIYSRRVDAIRYMREQFRDRIIRPAQVRDRFMLISPALAGELEPDAMVAFDRDLEPVIANPVFITRWGHLYIASLHNHHVVWCWNGERWDDISGGYWAEPHERAWMDCLARARGIRVYVHEIILP